MIWTKVVFKEVLGRKKLFSVVSRENGRRESMDNEYKHDFEDFCSHGEHKN